MVWFRAALCAALLALAGAAQAASYSISFTPQPGDYRLYEFTFSGPFSASAVAAVGINAVFDESGDFPEFHYAGFDWAPGCETSSGDNCRPKSDDNIFTEGWDPEGGYARFGFDFTDTTLTVTLDYQLTGFDHCAADPGAGDGLCAEFMLQPGFQLSWDTDAPFSYTVAAAAPGPAPAPEPATWAFLIGGFGMVGAALRGRRSPRTARSGQTPAPPSSRS